MADSDRYDMIGMIDTVIQYINVRNGTLYLLEYVCTIAACHCLVSGVFIFSPLFIKKTPNEKPHIPCLEFGMFIIYLRFFQS